MQTVGFIGLGNMGGPVVGHIQRDGFSMVVYDLRPDAMRPFLRYFPAQVTAQRRRPCHGVGTRA